MVINRMMTTNTRQAMKLRYIYAAYFIIDTIYYAGGCANHAEKEEKGCG